eukprot:4637420-Amphidinium_carterae.1
MTWFDFLDIFSVYSTDHRNLLQVATTLPYFTSRRAAEAALGRVNVLSDRYLKAMEVENCHQVERHFGEVSCLRSSPRRLRWILICPKSTKYVLDVNKANKPDAQIDQLKHLHGHWLRQYQAREQDLGACRFHPRRDSTQEASS